MIKLLHRLTMEEDVMAKKNTAEIGFERQIWDAACVLRGNMDASEYKNVVLGLIFLKYISDRFDEKYHLPATVQKPVNFISHICAFSRGALNVRSTRSHRTLAPRPQIWLMNFTGFCTVAGEDELNRKWEDWGTEADVFCLLENGWE